jgi:hypothetical protein
MQRMPYQLIILNHPSKNEFSKGLSSFVFLHKQSVPAIMEYSGIYSAPDFIIMEGNTDNIQQDLEILRLLKANPVFANVPLLIFTSVSSTEATLRYFEYGATTCMVLPAAGDEWVNIIRHIPEYWHDAA